MRLAITDPRGAERLYLGTVITNSAGLYSQALRAPLSGIWRATYQPAFSDHAAGSSARSGLINLVFRTEITRYSAGPRALALGGRLTIRGRVVKRGIFGDLPARGAVVQLYAAPDGKRWSQVAGVRTNGKGEFAFRPTVTGDGYWITRVPAARDYLATASAVTYVDGRHRTRISLHARPHRSNHGRVLILAGRLETADKLRHPLPGRLISIYVKSRRAPKARLLTSVKTNAKGGYRYHHPAAPATRPPGRASATTSAAPPNGATYADTDRRVAPMKSGVVWHERKGGHETPRGGRCQQVAATHPRCGVSIAVSADPLPAATGAA